MNTIITHFSPDTDAICSIWLIKRFWNEYKNAQVDFVPAGDTYNGQKVDSDNNIIHVDTGFGRFDHHQLHSDTCAAQLVFQFLEKRDSFKKNEKEAIKRMITEVNDLDHFKQVFLKDAKADRYDLGLDGIIDGLKLMYPDDGVKIVDQTLPIFDAILKQMVNKVWAEKVISEEGIKFKTKWGKALGLLSTNDEAVSLAQKMGFKLVVRKDPKKGYVRIKTWPLPKTDLSPIHKKLKETDIDATWFLHVSNHMILNGSTKNPKMRPTKLSLEEIIEIIKSI